MLDGVSCNIIVKDEGRLPKGSLKSCGLALTVEDDQFMQIHNDIVGENGILLYPEGAVTAAAHQLAIKRGLVKGDETAILFNRATRLKYPMPPVSRRRKMTGRMTMCVYRLIKKIEQHLRFVDAAPISSVMQKDVLEEMPDLTPLATRFDNRAELAAHVANLQISHRQPI